MPESERDNSSEEEGRRTMEMVYSHARGPKPTTKKKKKRNLVTEIVGVAFFELIEENQSEVGGGHLDKHVVLRQNNRLIIYWKNLRESETKHWKSRKKS